VKEGRFGDLSSALAVHFPLRTRGPGVELADLQRSGAEEESSLVNAGGSADFNCLSMMSPQK
jgi:hypothetical protein